jgi:hypothetical protein
MVVGLDAVTIVAIVGSLTLHVPPVTASETVVVDPAHTGLVPPLMAAGFGLRDTVAVVVAEHPPFAAVTVYTVVAVTTVAFVVEPVVDERNVEGDHV